MRQIFENPALTILAILYFPLYILWERPLILKALRLLNQSGPLHSSELMEHMGYQFPSRWILRTKYSWILSILTQEPAYDGLISVTNNQPNKDTMLSITLKGQKLLEKG